MASLVNPPSLHFVAVALLAELYGRYGHFPSHTRLRPVAGAIQPRCEAGAWTFKVCAKQHGKGGCQCLVDELKDGANWAFVLGPYEVERKRKHDS